MNIKISPNNSILKNKIMIELNRNDFIFLFEIFSIISLFFSERDQFERRIADLDRQIMQDQLQFQSLAKEKDHLLQQVNRNNLLSTFSRHRNRSF